MKFTCTPRVAFKDKVLNIQYMDIINAMEEFNSAREDMVQADASLEEVNSVAEDIDAAIKSIEEFGITVENMSVLNVDGNLESLMQEKISIEGLKSMSEESLEALEGRALESLGETAGKIWDAFVEGVKKVWEAIKRFFVSLWNRIVSLFNSDKDFYKKAMAAYDKLHKDPETEKKLDKQIASFSFSENIMKKFTEVQSFKEKALEDISVTFNSDKTTPNNDGFGFKGSGFVEYSQAKKFIDYIEELNKATEERLASVGGPVEFMLADMSKKIKKMKTATIDEKFIKDLIVDIISSFEKLPSMKSKLAQVTGGVLECEKLEVDFHGAQTMIKNNVAFDELDKLVVPSVKFKITLRCKEGNLGQLGWDKKKLLEVFDYLTQKFTTNNMTASQVERMCEEMRELASKIKVNTKSDDPQIRKQLTAIRKFVKAHSDFGREYVQYLSKMNVEMVRLRGKLKKIPEFILKHVDVGAMATMGAYADKHDKKK